MEKVASLGHRVKLVGMLDFLSRTIATSLVLVVMFSPVAHGIESASRPATPATNPAPLAAGDHRRELIVDGRRRAYLVHVPPTYNPQKPTALVLAFHGALMNATMMAPFCGLSQKADQAGFIVVYPNGMGLGEGALVFNASAVPRADGPADDVAFTGKILDDLASVANVDAQRVFATGMSNGGMMCHRLAAEMSDRIAAIAPVAGTLALPAINPRRPVPVIHFHGTADAIVPVGGARGLTPLTMRFRSVDDTVKAWVEADGCAAEPTVWEYPNVADDGTSVRRMTYGPGNDGAEVVLIEVSGGGHTWPGQQPAIKFLGKSTMNVAANDLMWEFFQKHPMK
jgi:polyhydroxybutyrate depolymerase